MFSACVNSAHLFGATRQEFHQDARCLRQLEVYQRSFDRTMMGSSFLTERVAHGQSKRGTDRVT